ncbi:C45 family autoproteolytic acyltransferase/hydrolase [candidate division KSB1 bacterium]
MIFISMFNCSKDSSTTVPNENWQNNWLPLTEEVNGSLQIIEGINVLRLWGTDYEQGYAYGYILSEEIIGFIDFVIKSGIFSFDGSSFAGIVPPGIERLNIEQRFLDEMQGIFDGIQARADGEIRVPSTGRSLHLRDIIAVNVGLDIRSMQCSSFSAWGDMTADGGTITGRNDDWPLLNYLNEVQMLVVVRVPPAGSDRLSFATINCPGSIGCPTGMNEEGVTLNRNAGNGSTNSASSGIYPRYFTYRTALENAHASTAVQDVENVLRSRQTNGTIILMITYPYMGSGSGSAVFEYDSDISRNDGVTIRQPESSLPYQIATNHYRERILPVSCGRYTTINTGLQDIMNSGSNYFTDQTAWSMLGEVAVGGGQTLDSTVFEPNKMLIHVAFRNGGTSAPGCRKVTLNVSELIQGTGFNINQEIKFY